MVAKDGVRLAQSRQSVTNMPHVDYGVGYTYIEKRFMKGNPMAKRKPTITIEDFNDGWADAYAKLLRNRKFQQAIHSEGVEDGMETMWLIDKLMQGVLKETKYEQLMAAFDDDIIDAWEYLSGKLPTITESPSKD